MVDVLGIRGRVGYDRGGVRPSRASEIGHGGGEGGEGRRKANRTASLGLYTVPTLFKFVLTKADFGADQGLEKQSKGRPGQVNVQRSWVSSVQRSTEPEKKLRKGCRNEGEGDWGGGYREVNRKQTVSDSTRHRTLG